MSDSAEAFRQALAKRNQQKAEEEARKANGGGSYTEVPFSALTQNADRVFRFLGLPYQVRKVGTDSKKIWFALCLTDSAKYARIIGPDPRGEETKNWILYRLMNTVLSYDWDADADGGKGAKIYKYQDKCPDIFNLIKKNNQMQNKYATGWQPNAVVLFNVIDRSAMDWHREHKKTRVLSKGCWEKDGKMNFDLGVPDTVYTTIMDDIVALDGNTDWRQYDIVIKRLTEKPWYKAYHPKDDAKRISDAAKEIALLSSLTEEEKSWDLWDFDKLYPQTKYKRLLECFGLTFQKVDKVFGKTFYEELKQLVEEEEKQETARKAAAGTSSPEETQQEAEESPAEETETPANEDQSQHSEPAASAAPVKTREPAPVSSSIPWEGLADGTFNGQKYLGVSSLNDQEKAWILGIDGNGKFKFAPEAGELLQDTQDKNFVPEKFRLNPYSNRQY